MFSISGSCGSDGESPFTTNIPGRCHTMEAVIQYWGKPRYKLSRLRSGCKNEDPPKFRARLRPGPRKLKASSNQTPSPMQQQPSELLHHHIYARRALCPLATLSQGCQRQARTHTGATAQGDQCLFSLSIAQLTTRQSKMGDLLSNGQVLCIMLGVRALP